MSQVIIDVREKDEFSAEHVENSINIPLSEFGRVAPGVLTNLKDRQVLLMCRSGKRASMAKDEVSTLGLRDVVSCEVYEGGILEWKNQGKPVVQLQKSRLPIMRQTQVGAGLLVLGSILATIFVDFRFIGVTAFVGLGLTLAGSTGFCLMAQILQRMPWNKGRAYDNCKTTC